MLRASILAIGVSALACNLAAAQRCQGFASLQTRPIQLFAGGLFGAESRWFGTGLAVAAAVRLGN